VETKTKDEWLPIFRSFDLPVNLVAIVEEILDDAQIRINNMVVTPEDEDVDTRLVINHPIVISDIPQVGPKRAPDLAEHRDKILEELGYQAEDIADLSRQGAFGPETT